jgi:hypothetical protein
MDLFIPREFRHGAVGTTVPQMWINLALQFIVLGLIVVALIAWRRQQLARHGKIMGIATVLAIASTALVMIPVFNDSLSDFLNDVQMGSLRAQVNLVHGGMGIAAVALTAFVTGRFAYGRFKVGQACYSKNLMRVTVGVWLVAIVMGILVFMAQALAWM